jgi:hypothetical protein
MNSEGGQIKEVILAVREPLPEAKSCYKVSSVTIEPGDLYDRALIGYSDLP